MNATRKLIAATLALAATLASTTVVVSPLVLAQQTQALSARRPNSIARYASS